MKRGRPGEGAETGPGGPEAFGVLFDRHARAVYGFCARRTGDLGLAEDLTSVVFLEAWRHRDRLEILTVTDPLPLLLGIANNVTRNARRSVRRYGAAVRRLSPVGDAPGADEQAVHRVDTERALRDALGRLRALTAREREVVTLVYWAGLTYEDAAVALRVPVGTVRSRLSRARAKVQSSPHPPYLVTKEST
ncbi:MAG: RNA polymerase sigma factor [Acidobacteriota bacterium]|nr:RNA polymerase sigma factor [Acidobacteriota bacterium]